MGLGHEVGTPGTRWRLNRRPLIGLLLIAIASGCSSAPAGPVVTRRSPSATVTPTIEVSPTPSASLTTDPARFEGDPRLEACGGLAAGVQQVVALGHAWAYRAVMPGIGFVALLDASADPALLVIYSGPIPAKLDWRTYVHGPPVPIATALSTPTPVPTPPPGTKNVCVALNAADAPQFVPDVPLQPFGLAGYVLVRHRYVRGGGPHVLTARAVQAMTQRNVRSHRGGERNRRG